MKLLGKALGAVAVAGAVAAGGSAFTAANTVPDHIAGIDSATISGATALSIRYTLNAAKDNIDVVEIVLDDDTRPYDVSLSFNGDNPALCVDGDGASYDAGATETTYECSVNQALTSATALNIVVADET